MRIKKYTYDDWWEGKIHLLYCPVIFPKDTLPVAGIAWESIIEADINKIKAEQKKLFEDSKNEILTKWENIFLKRYKNSEIKELYCEKEVEQCELILFGENSFLENQQVIRTEHWNVLFTVIELLEIRNYAKEIILKGNEINYDFIHSPNYAFQNKNNAPFQIKTRVHWEYMNWVMKFVEEKNKEKESGLRGNNVANNILSIKKEPVKYFPEYFIHEDRDKLVEEIKNEFKSEKGKTIRALIDILTKMNLVSIESRQKLKFYNTMNLYFDRSIGSYQSIFDYNKKIDTLEYQRLEKRINSIIEKLSETS